MNDINFYRAKVILPTIAETERAAEEYAARYSQEYEEELYRLLHSDGLGEQERKKIEDELFKMTMCLVFDFLRSFRYCVEKAEIFEDMMQEGFLIIFNSIPKWDIDRGSFRALCRVQLNKLYRTYYKEVSLRPQTGIQNDAMVRAYDNECIRINGKPDPPEKAAEALGKTVKMIEMARKRNQSKLGQVSSIEQIQDNYPTREAYSVMGQYTEDQAGRSLEDKDFITMARRALKNNKYEERLIFDFLSMEKNWGMPVKEFAEVIRTATGYNFSYQQIYRAKRNIGATLIYKGVLDRTFVKAEAASLDMELAKKKEAEERKKKKLKFLFGDFYEEYFGNEYFGN